MAAIERGIVEMIPNIVTTKLMMPRWSLNHGHFLYTGPGVDSGVRADSIDARPNAQSSKPVLPDDSNAVYVPPSVRYVQHILSNLLSGVQAAFLLESSGAFRYVASLIPIALSARISMPAKRNSGIVRTISADWS